MIAKIENVYTRRAVLVLAAVLVTPAAFVLGGIQELQEFWPLIKRTWRK